MTIPEAKDGEFRRIPLHPKASAILQSIPKTDPRIFPGITERVMRTQAYKIRKDADVKHIKRFWYSIRHTFATEYYQQTKDLRGLQEILGHSKIEMTTVYVNPLEDHKRQQIEKISYDI